MMTTNEGCSNEAEADRLPMELVREILTRVGCIKSAVKCKAVCKNWLSLISSSDFMGVLISKQIYSNDHEATNTIDPPTFALIIRPKVAGLSKGQFVYPKTSAADGFSSRFLPDLFSGMTCDQGRVVKVIASYRNLILCGKDDWDQSSNGLYICNVETMKWIAFPNPCYTYQRSVEGFGCDTSGKEFSVISINCDDGNGSFKNPCQFEAQIFSSKIGKWKQVKFWTPKPFYAFYRYTRCICYEGMLFFYGDTIGMIALNAIISSSREEKGGDDLGIRCHFIDWPTDGLGPLNYKVTTTVCLCQGRLRLIQKRDMLVNVWDLKDYSYDTSEWQSKDKINLTHFNAYDVPQLHYTPLTLLGFHPLDDATLYVCMTNRIVSYDLKTERLKCVFTIPDVSKTFFRDARAFDVFRPFWLLLHINRRLYDSFTSCVF